MDDSTPSSDGIKNTPGSDEIINTAPSAPSEFFTHLPESSEKAFPPEQDESAAPAAENAPAVPAKLHVDSQGRLLNPRSCVTCRRRKVKCDKTHPCGNCNRAHIECVFPSPGRAPRKARKLGEGRDKELLERLRRLEGVVKGMGVEVPTSGKSGNKDGDSQTGSEARAGSGSGDTDDHRDVVDSNKSTKSWAERFYDVDHQEKTKWVEDNRIGRFETKFGRLVVNEGKSRYINNSFWANLSNEVEDLKGILNQTSDDEDLESSPGGNTAPNVAHQGYIFGFSSANVDMLSLHPLPGQIPIYWETYKDRVDPLAKVLHIPTIEPTILAAASHLANLSKGFEALLFSIYYGAVTSVTAADCAVKFGEEKSILLARYRFAIEQALARANFLTTEEIIVLQAFVIFLICLRRNNDARVIWTLTGLIVRIAQTIGVHRDGSHFGLAPFEVEMRRRLWWQVCILDTRASEDHGCDPTIIEQAFDTKMPMNINDVDISPDMKEFPPERQGCTDMSFCLIRFEVANTFRRINYIPPGPPRACNEFFSNVTLQDKEKWITECHERLEERYLKHCDMSVPLFWVTATVARLMMSKMWLMVYHPFQRQDGGASLPSETKEKLFITSLENIEYSLLLETESRTMKWGWLFKTYMQWHALAFILSELCDRTTGDLVDRAWNAVEKTRDGRWGMNISENSRAGHLWRPLKKLYRKAKEARERGLKEEALTRHNSTLAPQRTYSPNQNPMFDHRARSPMTRAPLSTAQIQRFATGPGPSFGQAPTDKHELFSSPKPSISSGRSDIDPTEASNMQRSNPTAPQSDDFCPLNVSQNRPNAFATYNGFSSVSSAPQGFTSRTQQEPDPMIGPNFFTSTNANQMGGAANIDFSNMSNTAFNMPNSNTASNNPARMDSIDSSSLELGDLDMSVMDTSGDLNWENWDQLVKQFGMDVDGPPGAGGVATDWAGGNWDLMANGANSRMGMGMGGGDWF